MKTKLSPLEALEKIRTTIRIKGGISGYELTYLDIIETALKRLEDLEKWFLGDKDYKNYKALEIIKKKKVSIFWFLETSNKKEYNYCVQKSLTQEEYDLLKEVLL